MNKKLINIPNANILIMGLTFKENCQDLRNTKIVDLVDEFKKLNCNVDVYDPWVNHEDAKKHIILTIDITGKYDNYHVFKGISLSQPPFAGSLNMLMHLTNFYEKN